jgi:hypothetical protein
MTWLKWVFLNLVSYEVPSAKRRIKYGQWFGGTLLSDKVIQRIDGWLQCRWPVTQTAYLNSWCRVFSMWNYRKGVQTLYANLYCNNNAWHIWWWIAESDCSANNLNILGHKDVEIKCVCKKKSSQIGQQLWNAAFSFSVWRHHYLCNCPPLPQGLDFPADGKTSWFFQYYAFLQFKIRKTFVRIHACPTTGWEIGNRGPLG